jgi:hypothetical protein
MAYREETEGLRARVSELEQELAEAQAKISALEGRRTAARGIGQTLLGGPLALAHEIEIDGELPVSAHEEIVDVLRERFGALGQITTVGRTLAWTSAAPGSTRFAEVTISVRGAKTRIRASERLGNLAGGLYGGIVGGAGGGGMGLIVPLALTAGIAALIPLITVAWLSLVYAVVRIAYGRVAARRDAELASAVDSIAAVARTHTADARTRHRIADDDSSVEDEHAEELAPARKNNRRP